MAIDRDNARTWSKDRIREELADLRREISQYYEEIHDLGDEIDEEMNGIVSGASPRARSSDPYKHTDAMGDAVARDYAIITQIESDVEFLKSLLDDAEGKKVETKILPSVYQKPSGTPTYEYKTTKPIPRGRPGPRVGDTGDYIYRARATSDQDGLPLWAKWILLILALVASGLVIRRVIEELGW